ncbi:MAG: YicC family protein [Deltaproteobacteria bacterium]|nr:YicC family protein [Deltaproteobacteria bacterium]
MIRSMTAFGSAKVSQGDSNTAIEIKTVNNRHRDVSLHLPRKYYALEDRIKAVAAARIDRGRVDLTITTDSLPDRVDAFEVNLPLARQLHAALSSLNEALGLDDKVELVHLLRVNDIVVPKRNDEDVDAAWPVIQDCLNEAFDNLDIMRQAEGRNLADDLISRLDRILSLLGELEKTADEVLQLHQTRLGERMKVLLGQTEIDQQRLFQEAAYFAERSDITEELVRSKSHIHQFRHFLELPEPVGRRLDFLIQEMGREANTIGSKVGNAAASHVVVEIKGELERIREQVQNIE